uniref:NADH dehydrogenase subunit 6 n=1 Tax=Gayralia brasiliensis TaxID=1286870 RepID=UPI002410F37F|nr:NADH dehydrogenase subunit 6 [Gayralia brasiliensis]YP_010733830.1 NADH dehydrogenase subunit 6 [Monostroma nitidum]WEG93072.1 NADH dehydrogenase subunit 6 [Gayralia brasiliensis]WEG93101.1 NADH dehydrogenase subunit 6 [Monostroma nitidum]
MNLFFIFCALLISSALFVVKCNNPVYAVLFLILAFFNASALTLLAGHDYLAALLIVLYVGATCTFFLFAIMILNIQIAEISEKRLKLAPISAIMGIILALQLETVISGFESPLATDLVPQLKGLDESGPEGIALLIDTSTQIYGLGAILYTHYAYLLILASLILLSAMLGSIGLTLSKGTGNLRQQVFQQNIRDFRQTVVKHR